MSIQTLRSLAQLQKQAEDLGLKVEPTKRSLEHGVVYSKDDFVIALRNYYLAKMNVTKGLSLMLEIESPMLCRQIKHLKPAEQKQIWKEGSDWYFEEKEDGNRMLLIYTPENGFESYSRNNSVEDFLPVPYTKNILVEGFDFSKITKSVIIDCEVVSTNPNICTILGNRGCITETQLQATTAILALNPEASLEIQRVDPLQFKCFDVLYYDGEWVLNQELLKRKKILKRNDGPILSLWV